VSHLLGRFVLHSHIQNHEEIGMMQLIGVSKPTWIEPHDMSTVRRANYGDSAPRIGGPSLGSNGRHPDPRVAQP
jgi:hypothetical protein